MMNVCRKRILNNKINIIGSLQFSKMIYIMITMIHIQITMGYLSFENWEEKVVVTKSNLVEIQNKVNDLIAVKIDPFTVDFDNNNELQHHNHDLDNIVKNIVQEYLISQYRNKYDDNNKNAIETVNVDHISLDVLSSNVDADADDNDTDNNMMVFTGTVFFNSGDDNSNNNISVPSKESISEVTKDSLSGDSLTVFMKDYINNIMSLASIQNLTLSNNEGFFDPAAYAVSTPIVMDSSSSQTSASAHSTNISKVSNIATVLACAVAGVFGVLALSLLFVLKERQKLGIDRTTAVQKKSIAFKRYAVDSRSQIPEIQQAEEMSEGFESLNGLQVIDIDNVSMIDVDKSVSSTDTKNNVPSLSYSHSIANCSFSADDHTSDEDNDNISDVSVEDEYCTKYEKDVSKQNALNFRSIWNFGQNNKFDREKDLNEDRITMEI